jgi:CDP-6-deoxy-D-xylo-4-hexulose-3-dehydrase
VADLEEKLSPADEAHVLKEQILEMVGRYAELAHKRRDFVPGTSPVPISGKVFGAPELRSLVDSSLEFWLTTGRFNEAFERKLGKFLGRKYVLTCNSGSSANLLAAGALCSPLLKRPLVPGDEVITCATGFPTTVNPLIQNQLVPVFIDADLPTYNIRADRIESAITPKTRAIMVAHTLGNPFDLATVMDIAKRHDLYVVEDTCDALGATYDDKMVGTFGDIGTLSFYPAHHITMGEGGAVFTGNSMMKRALESLRDWGRDCWCEPGKDNTCGKRFDWTLGDLPPGYDHKYTYSTIGYNLKITDMQASVGVAQMDRLEGFIADRRANFAYLSEQLADLQDVLILPEATPRSRPSWFGFPITVRDDAPFKRDALTRHLEQHKIATRLVFAGNLIRQPYMKHQNYRVHGGLQTSDQIMTSAFWIGLFPGLGRDHLAYTVETLRKFVRS